MLTTAEKIAASNAMVAGDSFVRGNVLMFTIGQEYYVQHMTGPVNDQNRIVTGSWIEAMEAFERFMRRAR